MRIITLNVNGIRSAARKGFFQWLTEQQADVICLQEIRAQSAQVEHDHFYPNGYTRHFYDPLRKGYSGVGIYCRHEPKQVVRGLGFKLADEEARYIHADFGHVVVASLYMPSGTSGDVRQTLKYEFMDHFEKFLKQILKSNRPHIICGDYNIAHTKDDIKNWRSNQKNSGFLPEERAWLDKVFQKYGFVDAFRRVDQRADQYTWWSNRGRAWDNNVGWRIDYQVTTPHFKNKIKKAHIYKDERFSDHAPLVIDYDWEC